MKVSNVKNTIIRRSLVVLLILIYVIFMGAGIIIDAIWLPLAKAVLGYISGVLTVLRSLIKVIRDLCYRVQGAW